MKNWLYIFIVVMGVTAKAQRFRLLPDTIPLCAGDTASLEVRNHAPLSSVKWSTPAGIIKNTRRIKTSGQGKYYISATSENGVTISDSSYIKILPRPVRTLTDTVLCRRGRLVLDARNRGMKYQWNTGENTQQITVSSAGRYHVRISNGKCHISDTVRVKLWPPAAPLVPTETVICIAEEEKVLHLRTTVPLNVTWNNGATSGSTPVQSEGTYWVTARHPACGEVTDTVRLRFKACECEMIIPNSFTPNEDNRNDFFFPVAQCEYSYFMFTVSDRWGNTVYTSNSATGKWDGRYKGNPCPEDIYLYKIETMERGSDKKQVRNGQVALIR